MEKGQKLKGAEKKFSYWLVAAAAMHAIVIFVAIYLQILDARRVVKPKIVSVSLVSLPGSGGSPKFSEKQGDNEATPAPSRVTPNPRGSDGSRNSSRTCSRQMASRRTKSASTPHVVRF